MPYKSRAQQGYFNTHREELGDKVVDKWNRESKGQHGLPKHVPKHRPLDKLLERPKR